MSNGEAGGTAIGTKPQNVNENVFSCKKRGWIRAHLLQWLGVICLPNGAARPRLSAPTQSPDTLVPLQATLKAFVAPKIPSHWKSSGYVWGQQLSQGRFIQEYTIFYYPVQFSYKDVTLQCLDTLATLQTWEPKLHLGPYLGVPRVT